MKINSRINYEKKNVGRIYVLIFEANIDDNYKYYSIYLFKIIA